MSGQVKDPLAETVRQAIGKAIADEVERQVEQGKQAVEERMRGEVGRIVVSLLRNYQATWERDELVIRVKMDGAKGADA